MLLYTPRVLSFPRPGAVLDRRARDEQPPLRLEPRDDLRHRRLVVLQLVRLVADHEVDARVRHLLRVAAEGLVGHDEHLRRKSFRDVYRYCKYDVIKMYI